MTVHSAKGLEFPVVILADVTTNIASRTPDKHVDADQRLCAVRLLGCAPWDLIDHEQEEHERDIAEGIRIAYVAATRARDLLVVAGVGDGPQEGWLGPLNKALYPQKPNFRASTVASACPLFGNASVLLRPADYDGSPEFSVKPGLHGPENGSHKVVWWDPALLKLRRCKLRSTSGADPGRRRRWPCVGGPGPMTSGSLSEISPLMSVECPRRRYSWRRMTSSLR